MTQPIQFDTGVKKILLVEVPEGSFGHHLYNAGKLTYCNPLGSKPPHVKLSLPFGEYELLGIASEISEEVARTLVLWQDKSNPNAGFEHYMTDEDCQQNDLVEAKNTARQSILSICTLHKLPFDRTVILI